jgi:hypothetical protein
MSSTVTLSTGEEITLREKKELTERLNRPVEIAHTRATPVGQKLLDLGYKAEDPKTWRFLAELEPEEFDLLFGYRSVAIAAMVTAWPFELPITADGAMDLPPGTFEELSDLANAAWRGQVVEPDQDTFQHGGDSTV